jgi:hypothetical protein
VSIVDANNRHLWQLLAPIKTNRYMVSLAGTDDYVDKATGIRVIPAARFLTAFA